MKSNHLDQNQQMELDLINRTALMLIVIMEEYA